MTMIEKVARALAGATFGRQTSLDKATQEILVRDNWHQFTDQARAAVEALREPTEEMVEQAVPYFAAFDAAMSMQAGRGYAPKATSTGWNDSPVANGHRAMIDGILAEPKDPRP